MGHDSRNVLSQLFAALVETFPSPRAAVHPDDGAYEVHWFNPDNAGSDTHMGMRNLGHYAVGLRRGKDMTTLELFREGRSGEPGVFYMYSQFPTGLCYSYMAPDVSPQEMMVLAWCLRTLATLQREAARKTSFPVRVV